MSSVKDSSDVAKRLAKLAPEQLAQLMQRMQGRIDALKLRSSEPLAIVGLGCRFPGGANDAESFWRLLHTGQDAVVEVPADRWDINAYYDPDPEAPGKMTSRWGGFLSSVDGFDAPLFSITPREAAAMDPQQRLLLEVCWEALEDAGYAPLGLEGSLTGVYVGAMGHDYDDFFTIDTTDALRLTSTALSGCSGRVSYTLGLRGPSLIVDTACSSSLVALDMACQTLRNRGCDMALVGGINLILTPPNTIYQSKAGTLSVHGRCSTFDAAADGIVRGEGCGIVVVKRLSDALAAKDSIRALVLGTAVNQNGRGASFASPNAPAQTELLNRALANAGVQPGDIDFVEAHGTGTALGDPNELEAIAAAYCRGRQPDQRLAVGSVKTNMGHLETAAGIAGLIKVVLALDNEEIPPHLHLTKVNPYCDLDSMGVTVPTVPTPWLSQGKPRRAGVSSFGLSGTNGHVIVEQAPTQTDDSAAPTRPAYVLTVSAKTEKGLQQQVARLQKHLSLHPQLLAGDVCFTSNAGRSHFAHRLAAVAADTATLHAKLAAYASGDASALSTAVVGEKTGPSKVGFLLGDSATVGSAAFEILYTTQVHFSAAVDACVQSVQPHLASALLPLLRTTGCFAQAPQAGPVMLFVWHYAQAMMWRAWGLQPEIVAGFGNGASVAACISGALSLDDALGWIATVSREQEGGANTGAPSQALTQAANKLTFKLPSMSLVDNLTGNVLPVGQLLSHMDWVRQVWQPAGSETSRQALKGCDVVLDLSQASDDMAPPIASSDNPACLWLRPGESWASMCEALRRLYLSGQPLLWSAVHEGCGRRVPLPTYAFQRQRHWLAGAPTYTRPSGNATAGNAAAVLVQADDRTPLDELGDPAARRALVEHVVRREGAKVLGHAEPLANAAEMPLANVGYDSIMGIDLRNRLQKCLRCKLPATLTLEHPTVSALVTFLLKTLVPADNKEIAVATPETTFSAEVERVLQRELAHVLGYASTWSPSQDTYLHDLGFDPMMAVELHDKLEAGLKLQVPKQVVSDAQTFEQLVERLSALG